ncbi:Glycogen recognition site of AMP-activated protein kinase [Marinospirillum celere]|uniref:Glycogen recognition site of AMP-activated protein kinase n=1 Tax=Marinospirillum celere TaxID=1122252 RepID=A0A1I1GEI6_9GAMM|nr:hypothetical protein [Marinospirillum celere]SFC07560.1 Glycogen recognition site of AMP-activated protein kinase [Marinospirillum celere]
MSVDIHFNASALGSIQEVSLVLFKSWSEKKTLPMKLTKQGWKVSLSLPAGEYKYAFIVNGGIRLNDPEANAYAPDDDEKIWSVLLINAKGQRLHSNQSYRVHLHDYSLATRFDGPGLPGVHKQINLAIDESIVSRFEFTQVEGLHTVTLAWYTPDARLLQWSDHYLVENETSAPIELMFRCQPKTLMQSPLLGIWSLKMFIDGAFVLEDDFKVVDEEVYSRRDFLGCGAD